MIVQVKLLENFPKEEVLAKIDRMFVPAQPGDAGIDLFAAEGVVLLPGERKLVRTGIAVALPPPKRAITPMGEDWGYTGEVAEMQLRPKSGLAAKQGLTLTNSPATIDAGFRGEILVVAQNTNPTVTAETVLRTIQENLRPWQQDKLLLQDIEENTIRISRGEKICQAVFTHVSQARVTFVEELDETERGVGGFGSTGM